MKEKNKTKGVKAWAVVGNTGRIIESGTMNKSHNRLSIFQQRAYAKKMKGDVLSWKIIPVLITKII